MPIVGDKRYGPKRPLRVPGFPGRLWLHAATLSIADRVITAPLPDVLEQHRLALTADPVQTKPEE